MNERIIDWILHKYVSEKVKKIKKEFALCGENVSIEYPYIISHPELITIADNVEFHKDLRMQSFPEMVHEKDFHIRIGNGCFFGYRNSILAGADILIGDNVMCGSDVVIISYNHGMDSSLGIPYKDQKLVAKPIVIGNNCWIGEKSLILPGVKIGNNSVVGGGSVISKDVPENVVVVGNPAHIIRHLDYY